MEAVRSMQEHLEFVLSHTNHGLSVATSSPSTGSSNKANEVVEALTQELLQMLPRVIYLKRDMHRLLSIVEKEEVYLSTISQMKGLLVAQKSIIAGLRRKPVVESKSIGTDEHDSYEALYERIHSLEEGAASERSISQLRVDQVERENRKLKLIVGQTSALMDAKQRQIDVLEARHRRAVSRGRYQASSLSVESLAEEDTAQLEDCEADLSTSLHVEEPVSPYVSLSTRGNVARVDVAPVNANLFSLESTIAPNNATESVGLTNATEACEDAAEEPSLALSSQGSQEFCAVEVSVRVSQHLATVDSMQREDRRSRYESVEMVDVVEDEEKDEREEREHEKEEEEEGEGEEEKEDEDEGEGEEEEEEEEEGHVEEVCLSVSLSLSLDASSVLHQSEDSFSLIQKYYE